MPFNISKMSGILFRPQCISPLSTYIYIHIYINVYMHNFGIRLVSPLLIHMGNVKWIDSFNRILWVRLMASSMGTTFWVWKDRPLGTRNGPSAIGPQLFGSSALGWDLMTAIEINPSSISSILWMWIGPTLRVWNWASSIGPQLFGSSALVCYVMCLYSPKGILWMRFNGWYWNQSFIWMWIGPNPGLPKWAIRHWAAAVW